MNTLILGGSPRKGSPGWEVQASTPGVWPRCGPGDPGTTLGNWVKAERAKPAARRREALARSFFASLETELFDRTRFTSDRMTRLWIFD